MKKILFLDDDKIRAEIFLHYYPNAKWVKTALECIRELENNEWDIVCLDHDLNGIYCDIEDDNSGSAVVRYLIATGKNKKAFYIVHSHNEIAANDMIKKLREHKYKAIYRPFMLYDKDSLIKNI